MMRHNFDWNDLYGQISLGNGKFCFNADATGLQNFCGSTMSPGVTFGIVTNRIAACI